MGATAVLARFVCEQGSTPAAARDQVRRSLLDTLGTMLAGSGDPAGQLIAEFVGAQTRDGTTWVAGRSGRSSPMLAALANGTMGHALDFDDGMTFGHPGVAVVPAALAVAEHTGASGTELLDSIALGIEVAGRIGLATSSEPYTRGYHGTSVYGVLGATAAAGRLLRLNEQQMRVAFGIAASMAGGLRANFGTMTKPLHAGECGRAAVEAAMLAQAGFTASADIIECSLGYGDALLGHSEYDTTKMVADLGSRFIVEGGTMIKQYPCCYCNHATLNGMFNILGKHSLDASDVVAVHVTGSPVLRDPLIYQHPATGLQGKFSLPYNIALALVDGRVSLASFTDEHIRDGRLAEVIDKVTVEVPDGWTSPTKVRIEILTTQGGRIVHDQDFVDGDQDHPLAWSTIVDKFCDNAGTVLVPDAVDRTIAIVERLESQPSLVPLIASLADLAVA